MKKSLQRFWWLLVCKVTARVLVALCCASCIFLLNPAGSFGGFAVVLGQAINCTLRIKLKCLGIFIVDLFCQKPISL